MTTFVLIHGAGDVGWSWHRVVRALRRLGHDAVAPDLPCEDDRAGLNDYADTVIEAIGNRRRLVVVGHSYGGFTAPLIAARIAVDLLVFVAGMIPRPGEAPRDYWKNTRYKEAIRRASGDGVTGDDDPSVVFYHDVPRKLAEQAQRRERRQSSAHDDEPWPLEAWPAVPTKGIVCTEDRFFPPAYVRRVVKTRLGIVPDEITAGHCVALSRPNQLAAMLHAYVASPRRKVSGSES